MARWQPDAKGRLREAAITLFIERGYDAVTVADIAKRAGLTKRTFFNHFEDKREVMFADAEQFEAAIVDALAGADPELDPLDATVLAYTQGAATLADNPDLVRARNEMLASSKELQERELMKTASLTAKLADVLVQRGVPQRDALFIAQAGTSIFLTAIREWTDDPEHGLENAMQNALAGFKTAVA
ncbi:MAG TPA: helix-turn-helix domain-containing protein [Solirubrobacteraceae bacterium]|nr:helix-turn-helix domain-containing protein [Solirubrobacteraceae bacterium]